MTPAKLHALGDIHVDLNNPDRAEQPKTSGNPAADLAMLANM